MASYILMLLKPLVAKIPGMAGKFISCGWTNLISVIYYAVIIVVQWLDEKKITLVRGVVAKPATAGNEVNEDAEGYRATEGTTRAKRGERPKV